MSDCLDKLHSSFLDLATFQVLLLNVQLIAGGLVRTPLSALVQVIPGFEHLPQYGGRRSASGSPQMRDSTTLPGASEPMREERPDAQALAHSSRTRAATREA